MNKVCLVVIYNHQFLNNIEKIEKIYGNKFDKIYHLMPFYDGDRENVIPVFENSYQFSGYIAQGFNSFYSDEFSHYVFMGDDIFMIPEFSKETYRDILKIDDNMGFIARNLISATGDALIAKAWAYPSIINWINSRQKEEIENLLPKPEFMVEKLNKMGIKTSLISENKIRFLSDFTPLTVKSNSKFSNFFYKYPIYELDKTAGIDCRKLLNSYQEEKNASTKYLFPFSLGLSDFFVVPKSKIKEFAYYCGVFASARIFVEVGIPTALTIALDKISMPKDIGYKIANYQTPKRKEMMDRYGCSIKRLVNEWDKSVLLTHPVKFSMWELDIDL